jgi:PAS domain S-box-containing protein
MREIRLYGSEGGEVKAFPTPILFRERVEQGTWDTEYRVVRPDGTIRWIHDRAFPIREEDGRIHRIAGIAEDITERKRIEEDLRRRHMEQKAFSRIILATTTHLDRDIILQSALEGALELTGLEGGTICMVDHKLGILNLAAHMNVSEAVVRDLTGHQIKIGECLCGNVAKTGEPLILWDNASGSEFATREAARNEGIRFHASFPLVTKGEIIGVLCIFARSTTTPSKRSLDLVRDLCGPIGCAIENALLYEAERASRKHFTRIIESITDRFVALDRKGCFTYVNQRAAEMMGLPLGDLIGMPCWPEFPVPLCHSLYGPCEQALAKQEPRHLEEYLPEKQRWLDIRIYPSRDGLAVYFQDITELKQSLEELRKSHEHLEATFNALPDLLFELDGEGCILDYRAEAVELLYVPPEEFRGKTLHEVLPEEVSCIVTAAIEEARKRGSHRGAVYSLKTSAGLA